VCEVGKLNKTTKTVTGFGNGLLAQLSKNIYNRKG
jgi:hypothetical protein